MISRIFEAMLSNSVNSPIVKFSDVVFAASSKAHRQWSFINGIGASRMPEGTSELSTINSNRSDSIQH